jgi:uncharacterized membrane protein YgcG
MLSMIDEPCVPLSSNFRLVQEQPEPQHRLPGNTIAPAACLAVGQKRKALHRLVLSGCLCVFVLLLLAAPALSAEVTLAWDPNSEADLAGYGVFFKPGTAGPPYDFFGYVSLQDLDDPGNPTFTLTGLEKGSRYYFAVTAYDTAGNESTHSASVCAQVGDQILPCTSSDDSGGSGGGGGSSGGSAAGGSSGGGGSGGGCFIETSSDHQNKPGILMFTLLILGAISCMRFRMSF